eukprot:TRINITY_DN8794_c0_g1_i1.p1 TRINITY_DN8794_c0_g1~~TRINITY_DN8794_c0_g1_i1.p1  ORF type:complete len:324 (+),score=-73.34 TRINITY_DN8794_c0_g1_i1:249-1220(+)
MAKLCPLCACVLRRCAMTVHSRCRGQSYLLPSETYQVPPPPHSTPLPLSSRCGDGDKAPPKTLRTITITKTKTKVRGIMGLMGAHMESHRCRLSFGLADWHRTVSHPRGFHNVRNRARYPRQMHASCATGRCQSRERETVLTHLEARMREAEMAKPRQLLGRSLLGKPPIFPTFLLPSSSSWENLPEEKARCCRTTVCPRHMQGVRRCVDAEPSDTCSCFTCYPFCVCNDPSLLFLPPLSAHVWGHLPHADTAEGLLLPCTRMVLTSPPSVRPWCRQGVIFHRSRLSRTQGCAWGPRCGVFIGFDLLREWRRNEEENRMTDAL